MGLLFDVHSITPSWIGGGAASYVADYLSAQGAQFGSGIDEIHLTFGYDRWGTGGTPCHGRDRLPLKDLRRFERKKRILRVTWLTTHTTADDVCGVFLAQMTPELFNKCLDDIIDASEFGLASLKSSDDFDAHALSEWLAKIRNEERQDLVYVQKLIQKRTQERTARFAAMNKWDQLGLDWSKYAQDARALLDDPDDWSEGYDFAPHGNDTGADIWAEWETFRHLSPEAATEYVGMVFPHGPEDELAWRHWVQVHLALAFGHIKMSGTCPQPLRTNALNVLKTERTTAETRTDWPYLTDWLARLDRYIRILEDLPD